MGDGRGYRLDKQYIDHAEEFIAWWAKLDPNKKPEIPLHSSTLAHAVQDSLRLPEIDVPVRNLLDRFAETSVGLRWLVYDEIIGWGDAMLKYDFLPDSGYPITISRDYIPRGDRPHAQSYRLLVSSIIEKMHHPALTGSI